MVIFIRCLQQIWLYHAVDETDRRILRYLLADPQLATVELAARAGVSAASCWRRLERLRACGVIRGEEARIDWRKLGWEVEVSLRFTLDKTNNRAFDEFLAAAREVPEVLEIQTFLGRTDVRLNIIARDMLHYHDIYRQPHPDLAAYRRQRGVDADFDDQGQLRGAAVIDLDDIDRAILRALVRDAAQGAGAFGRALGLSQPAAWRRIRRLEEAGVLRGRRLVLDTDGAGLWGDRLSGHQTRREGTGFAGRFRARSDGYSRSANGSARAGDVRLSATHHCARHRRFRACAAAADHDFAGIGQIEANVLLSEERRPGPLG